MKTKKRLSVALILVAGLGVFAIFAAFFVVSGRVVVAGQAGGAAVAIDNDDIGGVVTGATGPEAGVWVIAETRTTADPLDQERGDRRSGPLRRPRSAVRGLRRMGSRLRARRLAESESDSGKIVNLKAVAAPDKKAAAQYYPAQYWFSLLQLPPKSDFPGTGDSGNGISPTIKSQGEWIRQIVNTDGCTGCHQLGGHGDAEIPKSILGELSDYESRLGSAHSGGAGRRRHERTLHTGGPRARSGDVRGLDRSHRRRRAAGRDTGPSAGTRAERRRSRCGTGRIPKSICMTRSRATSAIRP